MRKGEREKGGRSEGRGEGGGREGEGGGRSEERGEGGGREEGGRSEGRGEGGGIVCMTHNITGSQATATEWSTQRLHSSYKKQTVTTNHYQITRQLEALDLHTLAVGST